MVEANKENRKTSLEIRGMYYIVTWCDGSESEYQYLKEALNAMEEDFNKYD